MFLTYPQCEATREDLSELLHEVLKDKGITQMVIAQETHQDGGHHLHAYVSMQKEYIARGEHKTLKLQGHYPNVQGVRNKIATLRYL